MGPPQIWPLWNGRVAKGKPEESGWRFATSHGAHQRSTGWTISSTNHSPDFETWWWRCHAVGGGRFSLAGTGRGKYWTILKGNLMEAVEDERRQRLTFKEDDQDYNGM